MNTAPVAAQAPQAMTVWDYLRGLCQWSNWPYALGLLVLLLLIVQLVVMIKRRRKKSAAKRAKKTPKAERRLYLKGIWKHFLRGIPREFRRAISLHQPFVVLGEAGSGKSLLIDSYTDWRGHALEFYPSYATDPRLQIYLGSDVLVEEVPASLLHDTTKRVRTALKGVWKPICRRQDPKVVIVLNGEALISENPAALRKLARMIRGKINILSDLRGAPVKVGIALTHMDRIEGFPEFAGFLERNGIPLEVTFRSDEDLENLTGCLGPYEAYLPLALTGLPDEALRAGLDTTSSMNDYLRIISFFKRAPEFLRPLSMFIESLRTSDPLSAAPEVIRLDLTSAKEGGTASEGPFTAGISSETVRKFRPMLKHQVAALVIAVLGFLYMGGGYLYEQHTLEQAKNIIQEIQQIRKVINERMESTESAAMPTGEGEANGQQIAETAHSRFLEFVSQKRQDTLRKALPSFSQDGTFLAEEINEELNATIRNEYLIFTLKYLTKELLSATETGAGSQSCLVGHNEPSGLCEGSTVREGILYTLALIFASKDNDLGKLVKGRLSEWAEMLGFPEPLIETYVDNAGPTDKIDLGINLDSQMYGEVIMPTYDAHRWIIFFRALLDAGKKDYISRMLLTRLQDGANEALEVVERFQQHLFLNTIFKKLKEDPRTGLDSDWVKGGKPLPFGDKETVEFLKFVSNTKISLPDVKGMSLDEVIEYVKAMLVLRQTSDRTCSFDIAGERFSFSTAEWGTLIDKSSMALLMREFTSANEVFDGLLFFRSDAEFDDIIMNPTNDGRLFFTGKGRVDGRFTRAAFEEVVKPAVLALPDFLEGLPVSEEDKTAFFRFVFNETGAYAERYVSSFRDYYRQFDVKAATVGELRYVLSQIQQISSPLQDFLLTMKENTALDFEQNDSPFLQIFAQELKQFDFVRRLMTLRKGSYPELAKYSAIIGQLEGDIKNADSAPDNEADQPGSLEACLSPLGRISLSVIRDDADSHMNLVLKWLSSVSIESEWHTPFVGPVRDASLLGAPEVESTVNTKWLDLVRSEIVPLKSGFPFDKDAGQDVQIAVVESALRPQGEFWQGFNDYIAPVCQCVHGVWRPRDTASTPLKLPANALRAANGMTRLGKTLWDEQGIPKPLKISIKALPLPKRQKNEPVAVLSYLQVGKSTVFGFNQQPSWETLDLHWWIEQTAAVGLEFVSGDKAAKSYRSIEAPASHWSFYHLLLEAEEADSPDVLEWTITGVQSKDKPVTVKFQIKEDVWAPFDFDN